MPELPEVETIRRGLETAIVGGQITRVEVRNAKSFIGEPKLLTGHKITSLARRAKLLLLQLDNDQWLAIHLKMTGQLLFAPNKNRTEIVIGGHPDKAYPLEVPHKHTHVIIEFDTGTLYFNDIRKFGWIKLLDSEEVVKQETAHLGPEYTWPEFSLGYFKQMLDKKKRLKIKPVLLDQTQIAGIGNIYADEALFCASVLPSRTIESLTNKEITQLYKCIPQIFELSLSHGGTSSRDYIQPDGKLGTFLTVANVYHRTKLPCKVCGTLIEVQKIAGRSSHFCPKCQH